MKPFTGFPAGRTHITPIPEAFFSDLLPQIDHLGEMKVSLFAFWFLNRQEGSTRSIAFHDFKNDRQFLSGLNADPARAADMLVESLERAVRRGTLLKGLHPGQADEEAIYFLNTPRGRAALKAYLAGDWQPEEDGKMPAQLQEERPNIFKLYEENIGPLTPLIADMLRDAEKEYPPSWIEEAVRSAVESNVRSWRYVEAILRTRKERGSNGTNRKDYKASLRKYLDGSED